MTLDAFLPWQDQIARGWLRRRERFAHAWLIHGLAGIGKRQFALAAAASLLCESPVDGLACGACAACHWTAAGNHPDLRRIRPDAIAALEGEPDGTDDAPASSSAKKQPSKDIRVEQLRALSTWFNTATHRGGWRVAVLYPAESLNIISANALLKVLEEPPAHTVFLLVADAPDRLLPTLVSRCRRLPLPAPSPADGQAWLESQGVDAAALRLAAAGGAPVIAWQQWKNGEGPYPAWLERWVMPLADGRSADIAAVAEDLESLPPASWIDALQRVYLDASLVSAGAPIRYFPGLEPGIAALARRHSGSDLADMTKWLGQQRAVAGHPLNAKLLVQSVLQRLASTASNDR